MIRKKQYNKALPFCATNFCCRIPAYNGNNSTLEGRVIHIDNRLNCLNLRACMGKIKHFTGYEIPILEIDCYYEILSAKYERYKTEVILDLINYHCCDLDYPIYSVSIDVLSNFEVAKWLVDNNIYIEDCREEQITKGYELLNIVLEEDRLIYRNKDKLLKAINILNKGDTNDLTPKEVLKSRLFANCIAGLTYSLHKILEN